MIATDTWLKVVCGMMVNAVVFGALIVPALMIPYLSAHAMIAIPAVVIASFVISPFIAMWVAPRMRLRNWGKEGWNEGDLISG